MTWVAWHFWPLEPPDFIAAFYIDHPDLTGDGALTIEYTIQNPGEKEILIDQLAIVYWEIAYQRSSPNQRVVNLCSPDTVQDERAMLTTASTPMQISPGMTYWIYYPEALSEDGVDKKPYSLAIEPGKSRSVSETFQVQKTDWKGKFVTLCHSIRTVAPDGRKGRFVTFGAEIKKFPETGEFQITTLPGPAEFVIAK